MNSDPSSGSLHWVAGLRDLVNRVFDPNNLHDLALDFGLDYDELPGDSKARRVVEFIQIMAREQRVPEFIERCNELRSRENWQPFLEAARREPLSFHQDYQVTAPETAESKLLNIAMELLKAQSLGIEKVTRPDEKINQFANNKPNASDQTTAHLSTMKRNKESWSKSSKLRSPIGSSIGQPSRNANKNEQETRKSPKGGRFHGEIDRLETHIAGEIDSLLESIRQKIEELKLNLNDQQQLVPDEVLKAARKPIGFQEKQGSNFQMSKSLFSRQ